MGNHTMNEPTEPTPATPTPAKPPKKGKAAPVKKTRTITPDPEADKIKEKARKELAALRQSRSSGARLEKLKTAIPKLTEAHQRDLSNWMGTRITPPLPLN